MKLRKLLKEVRKCGHYYVDEIIEPTYDGKQFQVVKWVPMPPGCKSLTYKYDRFKTLSECYSYIDSLEWDAVQRNIERLRKKYNRPSKSKNIMAKETVKAPSTPPPPSYSIILQNAIRHLNAIGAEYEIIFQGHTYTRKKNETQ